MTMHNFSMDHHANTLLYNLDSVRDIRDRLTTNCDANWSSVSLNYVALRSKAVSSLEEYNQRQKPNRDKMWLRSHCLFWGGIISRIDRYPHRVAKICGRVHLFLSHTLHNKHCWAADCCHDSACLPASLEGWLALPPAQPPTASDSI